MSYIYMYSLTRINKYLQRYILVYYIVLRARVYVLWVGKNLALHHGKCESGRVAAPYALVLAVHDVEVAVERAVADSRVELLGVRVDVGHDLIHVVEHDVRGLTKGPVAAPGEEQRGAGRICEPGVHRGLIPS